MSLALTADERAIAGGGDGSGAAMAMRIVAESARLLGAPRLIPIASTHIDGALRLLNADLDPTAIPPRRRQYKRTHYFAHNELSRLCMDMLRQATGEPLTAEEITLRIMTAKGLDARDARLRATARVQIGAVLKRLSRKRIAAPSGKGVGATWRLLPSD